MSNDPNPFLVGADTGGPPLSSQLKCNFGSSASLATPQDTCTRPFSLHKAPYLTALVASSWRQRVRPSEVLAGSQTIGPSATKRFSCFDANGFSALSTTSLRGARSQFLVASTSWASPRACKRAKNVCTSSALVRDKVCVAMACTV